MENSLLTLVKTDAESFRVNMCRVRFPVFVDDTSLCTLLILLVHDLDIVVTDLKDHHR